MQIQLSAARARGFRYEEDDCQIQPPAEALQTYGPNGTCYPKREDIYRVGHVQPQTRTVLVSMHRSRLGDVVDP